MKAFDCIYEGGAFHPQLSKGKTGGTVSVDGGHVTFVSEKISFQLPLDGIEMKLGGAANRLVFFTHTACPEQTIYCTNSKILKNPQLKSQRTLSAQRAGIGMQRLKARVYVLAALVLLAVMFGGLYLLKDPIVAAVAKGIPLEVEEKLGETVLQQHKRAHAFVDSPDLQAQIQSLVEPLTTSIALERFDFKFHVVKDESLNAFALPGGHIVLNTGLIMQAQRPEEILGVVAHEIAHVTQQHGIRNVLEGAGLYVILTSLFGDVTGIAAVLMNNSAFLLKQQFSREFEREADALAVQYLVEANIDPSGLHAFFARLQAMEEASGMNEITETLSILSTHPATSERMDALDKIIDSYEDASFVSLSFDLNGLQRLITNSSPLNE